MLKQKMYEAVDGLLERIANEPDADDARANSAAIDSLVRAAGDPGALDWLESDSGGDGGSGPPDLSDDARRALRHLLEPWNGRRFDHLAEELSLVLDCELGSGDVTRIFRELNALTDA